MPILSLAAGAFVISVASGPVVLWGLRRIRVLDVPTARSSHRSTTPRGGGVAPALACVVSAAAAAALAGPDRDALLVASLGLGLIGLADDLHPRPALPRLVGQLVVALVTLVWLLRGLGWGGLATAGAGIGIVVGLVGYTNAFNFMDGINGLAVAQVIVAGGAWWVLGAHEHAPALAAAGAIVAAAAVGFAPFNAPQAKMFLGDVGSYFLGGWLAVTVVVGLRAGLAPEAVLAPVTVFLADAGVTLLQRVGRRQSWSQAHKEHAYQRLVQAGWSHTRTTLVVGGAMATTSALGALSLTGIPALRAAGDVAVLLVLAGYLKLPTALAARTVPGGAATARP